MAVVQNIDKVVEALQKLAHSQPPGDVIVGFTARYAVYIHENMEMKLAGRPRASGIGVYWGPHGENKFLEKTVNETRPNMLSLLKSFMRRGATLVQALYMLGLNIQRGSQERVPVEYGNLKQSAFTRIEE